MAAPGFMAGTSMALSASGGILGAFGANASGKAQAAQATYQSGLASINQKIAKQNADYARAAGEAEAQQSGMKTRAIIGRTRAIQGASGLDVNRGSALKVRESQADLGAQDAATIRHNAARKAYGYEVEALNKGAQADIYGMAAKNAKTASKYAVASSIIGGASSVADKWSKASQYGIFGAPASQKGKNGVASVVLDWDDA